MLLLLLQAERDELSVAKEELQRRLGATQAELHDKEEELFLHMERVVRLEEDCEKVSLLTLISSRS